MDRTSKLKDSLGRTLRGAFDLMVVNLLWIGCSLPVITVGPATTALAAVTLKVARDRDPEVVREFFAAFRQEFKKSLGLGALAAVILSLAAVDALFAISQQGTAHTLFLVVALIMGAIGLTLTAYGFQLLAAYSNSFSGHLRSILSLAVLHPGKTIAMWAALVLPAALLVASPKIAIGALGFAYVLFGVSGPMCVISSLISPVFDKFNAPSEDPESPAEEI